MSIYEELKNVISKVDITHRGNQSVLVPNGWCLPSRGAIKINSDVVVRGNHSFLGVVARNEVGDIVEAHSFKVSTNNPLVAEFMAI